MRVMRVYCNIIMKVQLSALPLSSRRRPTRISLRTISNKFSRNIYYRFHVFSAPNRFKTTCTSGRAQLYRNVARYFFCRVVLTVVKVITQNRCMNRPVTAHKRLILPSLSIPSHIIP